MITPGFWYQNNLVGKIIGTALYPLSLPFWGLTKLRYHLFKPQASKIPVICVGNIVAGGAGKTPVTMELATFLENMGENPHIVARGYGGSLTGLQRVNDLHHASWEVGDEPLLLSQIAPTWTCRDRFEAINAAAGNGASVVIMDDGMQNPTVYKDLTFCVIDGHVGFGNHMMLPAGPLREPIIDGLKRCQAIIMVGEDRTSIAEKLGRTHPVVHAKLIADPEEMEELQTRTVHAFAGIGRPQKFLETLQENGVTVSRFKSFADHHDYSFAEVQNMINYARSKGAILVTTEKDHVRLPNALRTQIEIVSVDLEWQNPDLLTDIIKKYVA